MIMINMQYFGGNGASSGKSGGGAGGKAGAGAEVKAFEKEVTDIKPSKARTGGGYNIVSTEVHQASSDALSNLQDGQELVVTRTMPKGVTQTISISKQGDTVTIQGQGLPEFESYTEKYGPSAGAKKLLPTSGAHSRYKFDMQGVNLISPNKVTATASTFTSLDLARLVSNQDRNRVKKLSFKIK